MKLGELINVKTGKLDANAENMNGQYPFFTCSKQISRIDSYAFDCECVLIAGNGELYAKYYNGKFNAYQRTYVIESNDKNRLDVKFLFYFFTWYIEILRYQSIGGVIKYIKLTNLVDVDIKLPTLEKQKQIVNVLENLQSCLSNKEKEINNLDNLIKSRFIEMFGDPVINSKKYETQELSALGYFNRGRSQHRPRNDKILLGGPYPLIQTGEVANADTYITSYEQTYSEEGLKQSRMWNKGTLCITIAANIAKTAILGIDACFPDSIIGFIPYDKVTTLFIHNWFKFFQPILEDQAPAAAQKNLNGTTLGKVQVIVPPIKEQIEYETFVKLIDKSKFSVQKEIELYKELLEKKMNEYFG